MSNLEADLSDSRLIVANVEEKEYHFIVREHPIVGKMISLLENGKEYGLIDKQINWTILIKHINARNKSCIINSVYDYYWIWSWFLILCTKYGGYPQLWYGTARVCDFNE